jgi:ribulose-5-phosphate 4-epimerase/fuculose-1-phosphate aldolase
MENHGMIAQGVNMKQAFYRCLVVEDAAKSMIAACIVGKPRFLTSQEQADLFALGGVQHRIRQMSEPQK